MKKFAKIVMIVLALSTLIGCCFAFSACNDNKIIIGAQSGTTGELYLKGDKDMGFSGFKNIKPATYDSIALAVQDMINGNISMVVSDIEPAKAAVTSISGAKYIDVALSSESYAIGVNKTDTALLKSINKKLASMKTDGSLDTIISNYSNKDYAPTGYPAGTPTTENAANQLVIATNAEFEPFEFKKGENFVGIDIEIAKAIADELNMELVIVDMDFDSVVTSVGKNNIDIALAGLTVNESRKVSITFSDSYYTDSYQVIIVKSDDNRFDGCTTKEQVEKIIKNL